MVIYNGLSGLTAAHFSGQTLSKIYSGSNLVWPTSTPPIPIGNKLHTRYVYSPYDEYHSIECNSSTTLTSTEVRTCVRGEDPTTSSYRHITEAVIGDCVTATDYNAFHDCVELTSVTIPNSVTTIGGQTFYNCSALPSITIPSSVTTIDSSAFGGCTSLSSIVIPSNVTTLGNGVFGGCTSLLTVYLPSSIGSVPPSTFASCTNLTGVTLQEGLTAIGQSAFASDTSIVSITLPSTITTINKMAFYNCSRLEDVTILATTVPTLANTDAFKKTKIINDLTIYVPDESVSAYKTAANWSTYANIIKGISEKTV